MNTARFEVFKDAKGEWRWHLLAANNKIVATSGEGYKNRADCVTGLGLVRNSHFYPTRIKDE